MDFDWNSRKVHDVRLGMFKSVAGLKFALTYLTNWKDGCWPLKDGKIEWRVIYKASLNTDIGVNYWNQGATNGLNLGVSTQLNETNNLKFKINKEGLIGFALKSLISPSSTLLASAELSPSIIKGKACAQYGFGYEFKL